MPASDEVGRRCLLNPTPARAALVQMFLVALHAMGDVRRGTLLGGGDRSATCRRITLCLNRGHPRWWHAGLLDGALEARVRRRGIPSFGEIGVTHWAIVVDRPLDVRPRAGKSRVGFINAPRAADRLAMRTWTTVTFGRSNRLPCSRSKKDEPMSRRSIALPLQRSGLCHGLLRLLAKQIFHHHAIFHHQCDRVVVRQRVDVGKRINRADHDVGQLARFHGAHPILPA